MPKFLKMYDQIVNLKIKNLLHLDTISNDQILDILLQTVAVFKITPYFQCDLLNIWVLEIVDFDGTVPRWYYT